MTRQGLGDKTYDLLQVPYQWTILHASQVLSISNSKRCIVYTCICVLQFFMKEHFLLYVYLQNGKKQWRKRKKKERTVFNDYICYTITTFCPLTLFSRCSVILSVFWIKFTMFLRSLVDGDWIGISLILLLCCSIAHGCADNKLSCFSPRTVVNEGNFRKLFRHAK